MKKRFLDRFTYPYLQKRLPENVVPGRGLSAKRVKLLHKGKPLRPPMGGLSSGRGKISNMSPGLCLRLMRGTLRLHKRGLFGEKHTWCGVDTLERGSLASASCPPSMIRLGGHAGGCVAEPSPRPSQPRYAKAWIRGLPYGRFAGPTGVRDAAPTPQLEAALFSKEGHDSIYSSVQLEEALTKQQERRPSPLLLKLMERTKLRIMYGNLANRQLDKLIERGLSTRGGLSDNLFRLLESRIDVFLCRVGFFATIATAHQWIHHGKVLINNKIATTASHMLKPGDVVSISASNIAPLRESLQERSRELQIWKGFEGFAPHHRCGARPTRGQESAAWAAPSQLSRLEGVSKASKARLSKGAASGANAPGTKSPPNFLELVGGSHAISGRPARVDKDVRRDRLRWFNVKPSNAEISYRCLTAIYLYPPQQLLLPARVDVERIRRS